MSDGIRAYGSSFLLLIASVLSSACQGPACPVQLHTDPTRVLGEHSTRASAVRTLRAEATVDQRGPEGRVRGKVMMFLERPDHVRFDAVTQFGPALVLTSDGQNFALSDFKENRYLNGPACARNIARMIGVAMSAEDVVSILFGDSPRLAGAQPTLQCSNEGGYRVDLNAQGGERQELVFAVHEDDFKKPPIEQRLRLVRSQRFDAKNKALWRVSYDDYRQVQGGLVLPFRVHVEDVRRGADALLRFDDIDVNVPIPTGAFSQTPRTGLTIEDVSCE